MVCLHQAIGTLNQMLPQAVARLGAEVSAKPMPMVLPRTFKPFPVAAEAQDQRMQQLRHHQPQQALSRRQAHALAAAAAAAALLPRPAAASGLLQFPLTQLSNTYYLVRAGESVAEAQGYILTNPVAKTSTTCGLSMEGKRQVRTPIDWLCSQ